MSEFNNDIPSGRIRFALQAMREFERMDGCEIDMCYYRMRDPSKGTCYACCGGSARTKLEGLSVKTNLWEQVRANEYEESLDCARCGYVGEMFVLMELPRVKGAIFDRGISHYDRSPAEFYQEMEELADDLEESGF